MTVRSKSSGKVTLPVVLVAAVALIAFMVWLGYRNFGPPKPFPKSPEVQAREDRWDQLAKKSHGDISKLSPEEQQSLMQETGGHGAQILQAMARQHGY